MTRFIKEIRRFKAMGDNGKQYTIVESQDFDRIQCGGDTVHEVSGLKRWKTTTGLSINETTDAKTFQIVTTNEIIREI